MNLSDLIRRTPAPEPWAEGDNIPWNEPGFSERMLVEHLSQEHDAASRRMAIIDRHVSWIHHDLLHGQPSRILDLGCGPGLYTSRLAKLGHTCAGIDFSPASIRYAQETALRENLPCTYLLEDLRRANFGFERSYAGYSLVMLIFGEFNVFQPTSAEKILRKAQGALLPGGILLLEPHPYLAIQKLGQECPRWSTHESGLFSDHPYLSLEESFWDGDRRAATNRYWIYGSLVTRLSRKPASRRSTISTF